MTELKCQNFLGRNELRCGDFEPNSVFYRQYWRPHLSTADRRLRSGFLRVVLTEQGFVWSKISRLITLPIFECLSGVVQTRLSILNSSWVARRSSESLGPKTITSDEVLYLMKQFLNFREQTIPSQVRNKLIRASRYLAFYLHFGVQFNNFARRYELPPDAPVDNWARLNE